jgi:hypothetical protein
VRAFENRALRIILGPKRVEVVGGWRKPHNFYSSSNIIEMKSRRMRWAGRREGGRGNRRR